MSNQVRLYVDRVEHYIRAIRNNPLLTGVIFYFIMLALYASFFYIFAIKNPFTSAVGAKADKEVANVEVIRNSTDKQLKDGDSAMKKKALNTETPTVIGEYGHESSNTEASVTVNGQSVDVPTNGHTHTTVSSPDGSSDVDVSITSESSSSTNASSTMEVNIQSSSSTVTHRGEW
jgi:hypothetical protein